MITTIIILVTLYFIFLMTYIYLNIIQTIKTNITLALIEAKINDMNNVLQSRDNIVE